MNLTVNSVTAVVEEDDDDIYLAQMIYIIDKMTIWSISRAMLAIQTHRLSCLS